MPDAKQLQGARTAIHPATSAYRPNRILCDLARRRLAALPAEFQNSKPDYWHGLDKPPHSSPVLGQSAETLYIHEQFTMGTMWSDPDTCTQLTRMQLGVPTPGGVVAFTGSAPGSYNGEPRYTAGQGTHISRPGGDVDPKTESIHVQYATGRDRCDAWLDDRPVRLDCDWVYDGPCVKQKGGILTINNGRDALAIDFSGDLPVYQVL